MQMPSFHPIRLAKTVYWTIVGLPLLTWKMILFIPFLCILALLLMTEPFKVFGRIKFIAPLVRVVGAPAIAFYSKLLNLLNKQGDVGGMKAEDLVLLAMSHLKVKKVRSLITIGGMAIGFGSVIFLLSLGYGFQRLVVSRVATLGEMKQIDVTTSQASSLAFNSAIIDSFISLQAVDEVLPVISTVSKVSFNNSVSDIVAYGVTTAFLEESAVKPTHGEIFTDERYVSDADAPDKLSEAASESGTVAGAQTELVEGAAQGQELHKLRYSLYPQVWQPVYEQPSLASKIIGYTKRITGDVEAREVWGGPYSQAGSSLFGTDEQGNSFQTWISDTFPLWQKTACSLDNFDCMERQYLVDRGSSGQQQRAGFITQEAVAVERYASVFTSSNRLAEGTQVQSIQFAFPSTDWQGLYDQPKESARNGSFYTKSESTSQMHDGVLIVGEYYYDVDQWGYAGDNRNGKKLGYWIKATMPVWRKLDCGEDCDYYLTEPAPGGEQLAQTVFVRASTVKIDRLEHPPTNTFGTRQVGQVLGESTEATAAGTLASASSASASANISALDLQAFGITGDTAGLEDLDWASIASQAGILETKQNVAILPLPSNSRKVALVNTAMLTLLGLQPNDAIGKEFGSTFLLDGKLFDKENYSAESEATMYKIVGVLPDDKTPAFYVPLGDIKGLGVKNYSQLKIIAKDTNAVPEIRSEAEVKGFRTSSVVDTVAGINQLFAYLRIGLLILGLIALGVAALGMFNTLTVSLLEKTREVGLMKAMGMKSREVQRLFIAESVIMGVSGGVFGLIFGFVAGKMVSLVLTSISIAGGSGSLDIAYIPFALTVIILVFSLVVGVLTGWYPAYRATQVSALNALRYE